MRTTQELLEYVDRMIDVSVDKMETCSPFALIELKPASIKQDEICNELEGMDGAGI